MNFRSTTIEKNISSVMILLFALAGFGPLFLMAWQSPYSEKPLLFISAAMVVFAVGLFYEAAERLLEHGRSLYAAAVFCSIPAVCVTAADVSALPLAGLMLMVSVGLWLAARARGEERPFFLAMIGVLTAAGGYLFLFSPETFALIFVGWIAARSGRRPMLARFALAACLVLGVFARGFLPSFLPTPDVENVPTPQPWMVSIVLALPWVLWVLPVLWRRSTWKLSESTWRTDVLAAVLFAAVAAGTTGSGLSRAMVSIAPMLALLAGDVMHEEFDESRSLKQRRLLRIPTWLAALCLLALSVASLLPNQHVLDIAAWQAVLLSGLAVAVAATSADGLPRWSFPLLFASGVVLATVSLPRQIGVLEPVESAGSISVWMVGIPALMVALIWLLVRRRFRLALPSEHRRESQFGGENFRIFRNGDATVVPVGERIGPSYQVIVFGDVAGAESLMATARGGYFVFRSLARVIEESRASFVLSLGDLTSQSSASAYRRLPALLGTIPLPLMATPGNHDLFRGTFYDDTHFHEMFGADNATFRFGPVKFILLNNGAGYIQDPQFDWLEQILNTDPAPFTLLFCHKPPFDFRTGVFYAMETREHAERLHALLTQHKVDAAFSGHIHSLLSEEKDGVTYVVSGGGGSKLVSGEDQHHYLTLDVGPQEITVRALPLTKSAKENPAALLELHLTPRT